MTPPASEPSVVLPHPDDLKLAWISSPYKGGADETSHDLLVIARGMCLLATRDGYAPFASHLIYTQFWNDQIPEERKLGMDLGRRWLHVCQRMYYYAGHEAHNSVGMHVDRVYVHMLQQLGHKIECVPVYPERIVLIERFLHTPDWLVNPARKT